MGPCSLQMGAGDNSDSDQEGSIDQAQDDASVSPLPVCILEWEGASGSKPNQCWCWHAVHDDTSCNTLGVMDMLLLSARS